MSGPPVPGKANLHVALAIALGKRAQESDATLIEEVCRLRHENDRLRRQLDDAEHGPDLFTAFEAEAS